MRPRRTPPLTLPRISSVSVTAGMIPSLLNSDRSPPISPRSNFVGSALGGGGAGVPAEASSAAADAVGHGATRSIAAATLIIPATTKLSRPPWLPLLRRPTSPWLREQHHDDTHVALAARSPRSHPRSHTLELSNDTSCRHSVPWSSDTRLPACDPI